MEGEKHVEHALSSNVLSRTEINGSRRTRRDPAGVDCVTDNPLPRLADLESSIFTLELESFVVVEAVTGIDAIYFEDAVTDGVMVVFSLPMANSRYYNSAQVGLRIFSKSGNLPAQISWDRKTLFLHQPTSGVWILPFNVLEIVVNRSRDSRLQFQ